MSGTPPTFVGLRSMSETRDQEARSWDEEEADGDRAIADMRQSLDRLRGQVGAYREQVGENDVADDEQAGA
jgi:hypothetical protein